LQGVEIHKIDSSQLQVYCVEKTLADCFKFRRKVGMDVVLEALRNWARRKDRDIEKLLTYACYCRVEKVMKPYLEGLL
jgi:hypothetical protein